MVKVFKRYAVKKEKKDNRSKRIYIRLKPGEYNVLHEAFEKTTMKKFSEYTRSVLLKGPVIIYTRNKSYDEFIEELVKLKSELNAIGNNFNQAVKKLHTITHDEEIKGWALLNEKSKELFNKKIDEIELKMIKISEQWSQG